MATREPAVGREAGRRDTQALALAAFFCFGLSILSWLLLSGARWGLPGPQAAWLRLLLVAGGILFAPLLLPRRLWSRGSPCAAAVFAAGAAGFLAHLDPRLPRALYALLFGVGLVRGWRELRGDWGPGALPCVSVLVCIAVYVFFASNERPYAGVYAWEQALVGTLNRDTYLHAGLANVFFETGVVSLGTGGLTPFRYHFGAHAWLGPLASVADAPVLQVLPFALRTVVFPCLFFALFLAMPQRRGPPWTALGTMLIALGITELLGWQSQWFSESYALALVLFCLGLACVPELASEEQPRRALAGSLLLFCTLGVSAVLTKLSVGLLLLGFGGFLMLRTRGLGWPTWAMALVTLAALWLGAQLASPGHGRGLVPLAFLRKDGPDPLLASLLPLAAALWLLAGRVRGRAAPSLPRPVLEGALITAVVAVVVPNVVEVAAGGGWYFVDVSRWIGLWLLLALGCGPWPRWMRRPGVFYGACLLLTCVAAARGAYEIFERSVLPTRAAAARELECSGEPEVAEDRGRGGFLGPSVAAVVEGGYARRLLRSAEDRLAEAGHAVLYIPQDSFFWSWPWDCGPNQGFFWQAMTSTPLLNGRPFDRAPCERSVFDLLLPPVPNPEVEDVGELCALARERGFGRLLVLRGERSAPVLEVAPCQGEGPGPRAS